MLGVIYQPWLSSRPASTPGQVSSSSHPSRAQQLSSELQGIQWLRAVCNSHIQQVVALRVYHPPDPSGVRGQHKALNSCSRATTPAVYPAQNPLWVFNKRFPPPTSENRHSFSSTSTQAFKPRMNCPLSCSSPLTLFLTTQPSQFSQASAEI